MTLCTASGQENPEQARFWPDLRVRPEDVAAPREHEQDDEHTKEGDVQRPNS